MVYSVAFSPDGTTLASGSSDDTVRLWNVNTQGHLRTINVVSVSNLALHPSKQILAVGGSSGVYLYNPNTGHRLQPRQLSGSGADLAFHPNGQFLATNASVGGSYSAVKIWKLVTANRLDVNKDGQVDINDLITVARNYGRTDTNNADVNNDNRVDIDDLTEVAEAVNPDFAAPTVAQELPTLPFTAEEVQQWIQDAKKQGIDAEGIATLEQLLKVVLQQAARPQETALLANYPNPFNPETWIPY